MTGLDRYISELLFDHDCVILPGFGGFLTNYSGARIHPIRHSFHPPARTVVFNANLRTNDGLLIDYISRSLQVSYRDASQKVNEYALHCMTELENGSTVNFTNIGSCRMGRENNIIFDPDLSYNYLDDAFGLPSFVSPAIKRESVRQRLEKQLTPKPVAPGKKKDRKIAPLVGWAAGITIPVAAALLLYFYNPAFVDDLGRGYASFVPTVKFASADHADEKSLSADPRFANFRMIPETVQAQPAETESPIQAEADPMPASQIKKYQIVVGAFSEESNASKYVRQLQARNYPASIIGTNAKGLFRVSISGHDSRSEAFSMLESVRASENPSAWLLVIR
ncbi:MAG TPA: SPOR domain-containing protein [Bacteroidales bacterium]|nr:SPOR domain-containing protein [Bacteroidales bacterium]